MAVWYRGIRIRRRSLRPRYLEWLDDGAGYVHVQKRRECLSIRRRRRDGARLSGPAWRLCLRRTEMIALALVK